MKALVIGAAGNTGTTLVRAALAAGHDVTAFVRNREKFFTRLGSAPPAKLNVVTGDASDAAVLSAAMRGQDVVINAAGNVSDGPSYAPLIARIVTTAAETMGPGGRFWFFGGLPLLDIPGTSLMGLDLPGIPKQFQMHKQNWEAAKATQLDWSMLAPGFMHPSPNGKPHDGLLVSAETWPVPGPSFANKLPRFVLTAMLLPMFSRFTIFYEDAAKVIVDNLSRGGPYKGKRVALVRPANAPVPRAAKK